MGCLEAVALLLPLLLLLLLLARVRALLEGIDAAVVAGLGLDDPVLGRVLGVVSAPIAPARRPLLRRLVPHHLLALLLLDALRLGKLLPARLRQVLGQRLLARQQERRGRQFYERLARTEHRV